MNSPIPKLKSKFIKCVRDLCESQKCKLTLAALPSEKLILNIDCIAKQKQFHIEGKRCDRIIVIQESRTLFLVPVEFKTGQVHPTHVKAQLEGGIKFFKDHYQNSFKCYPVLVSRSLNTPSRKKLEKTSINYNGRKVKIRHVLCGQSLPWNSVQDQNLRKKTKGGGRQSM